MLRIVLCALVILLTGCVYVVRLSTVPLATNVVQVTARASSACGQEGAEKAAFHQASIETIKRGFDRFMVVSSTASTIGQYIGTMPVTGQVTPYGQVNVSGGQPLVSETHNQVFAVKMFREGDPAGDKALSARVLLGDNWTELVAKNKPVTGCP